jgi:hypothetical protein
MSALETKITPCTKCGAKAVLASYCAGWYHVRCSRCNAAMHHETPSPYEAVVQWNATAAHIKERAK